MTGDSPTLRDATPIDPARAVEDAEDVATHLRLRMATGIGSLTWITGIPFDLDASRGMPPEIFHRLLVFRLLGQAVLVVVWLRLRAKKRPSHRALRAISFVVFGAASAAVGVMAVIVGNVGSAYYGAAMVILAVYGATVSEHWRRGVFGAFLAFAGYPFAFFVGALVSPRLAAELSDVTSGALFRSNVGNMLITYCIAVLAGHVSWTLRRQVYEARNLGRYKLKKRIGQGGMGEVWVAHHSTLKRDVAVKILRMDRARSVSNAVPRFEREVRATCELAHPNTVRVFDYGVTDDGVWYYAMELLDGESLGALVAREGALPSARAVHLVSQAARALAEAHEKGIVHRDVKPENLFVARIPGEVDFVKVLDFGIAKVASEEADAQLTATGALVGTPAWIAPETLAGAPIDARADVYALGAVLYYTLAGRPPFESRSGAAVASAHLGDLPAPPSEKRGAPIAHDLESIVMRCLEKDPKSRYASARELADALAKCVDADAWAPASASKPAVEPAVSGARTVTDTR